MKRNLLLGLLVFTGFLNAQKAYKPGFIINHAGDSIYGDIDYRGDELMSKLCTFRSEDNTVFKYSPNDIQGYRFIDSKFYVTRDVFGVQRFIECLLDGEVNIYYNRDENGEHYYLDRDDMELIEMPYEERVKEINGAQVPYKSTRHIGVLNLAMQDAPGFESRINTIVKPNHKNLINLAEDYHNVVCTEEKCVVYRKESFPFKFAVEPVFGITRMFISMTNGPKMNFYIQDVGAHVYIWLPRANEKLYFKTGYFVSRANDDFLGVSYSQIPLQIQYIYREYRLQPSISAGANLLFLDKCFVIKQIKVPLVLNVGLNYKLSDHLSVSAGFNYENMSLGERLTVLTSAIKVNMVSGYFGLRVDL